MINPPSCNGLVCNISGVGSADPNPGDTFSYVWNFGDSTTSTSSSMCHTFPAAGTYTVTLTVTDGWGKATTVQRSIRCLRPSPEQQITTEGPLRYRGGALRAIADTAGGHVSRGLDQTPPIGANRTEGDRRYARVAVSGRPSCTGDFHTMTLPTAPARGRRRADPFLTSTVVAALAVAGLGPARRPAPRFLPPR